jgi:hypothetical protein
VAEKNIGYDGRLIFAAQEVDLDGILSAKLMYQTWLIADGDELLINPTATCECLEWVCLLDPDDGWHGLGCTSWRLFAGGSAVDGHTSCSGARA